MEQMMRKYPVGIQTFERLIRDGLVYVDKTDLVWKLAHYATFVFMSRPRRFGKSLLTSTLESYFKGDRELFEGLRIMSLEKEWTQYPVLHLDLSVAKGQDDAEGLRETLMWMMEPLANIYGRKETETTPGKLLTGLIHRANEQTGRQVAVIVDEYDAPLLDVLHSQATLDAMRKVMQEFYVPLRVLYHLRLHRRGAAHHAVARRGAAGRRIQDYARGDARQAEAALRRLPFRS